MAGSVVQRGKLKSGLHWNWVLLYFQLYLCGLRLLVVGMSGALGVIWAEGGQVLQSQWESGRKSAVEGTALHSWGFTLLQGCLFSLQCWIAGTWCFSKAVLAFLWHWAASAMVSSFLFLCRSLRDPGLPSVHFLQGYLGCLWLPLR